jgi:hypothetical protein
MLKIECNLNDISVDTVTKQFLTDLQSRVNEARSVFLTNLTNIVVTALDNREVN